MRAVMIIQGEDPFPLTLCHYVKQKACKSSEELQIDIKWHHSLINTVSSLYFFLWKKMTWEKIVEFVK